MNRLIPVDDPSPVQTFDSWCIFVENLECDGRVVFPIFVEGCY